MNIADAIIGRAWAQETHSETHAGTEAGDAGGHGGAFPPFDPTHFASQLLWLAITFGIFYMLMARVAIPRIGGILETRRDRISQDIDEAQRMKDEADAAYAAYEQELAEARSRAGAIAQTARDEAKADADAERQRIEQSLAEKLSEAEAKIAGIKAQALAEVDRIAVDTTQVIVSELIGGTTSAAEVEAALGEKR